MDTVPIGEPGASGSLFETKAKTAAGSNQIQVQDPGNFRPGQWVIISKCHVHYEHGYISGPEQLEYLANIHPWESAVECRGFDGQRADWTTFILHIENADPLRFSWLVAEPAFQPNNRRWQWQGRDITAKNDWLPLMDGVEIRFRKKDWQAGQVVQFHARNRLVTRISKIEGQVITLEHAPTCPTADAVMYHCAQFALQEAIDRAICEKQPLHIPAGRYRLLTGLQIRDAAIEITGDGAEQTILDISDGIGAVFGLTGGKSVAVRRLGMVGHTGFNELPWHSFRTKAGSSFWPTANQQALCKGCAAAYISATEQVLFEDVTVRRMAAEAFYARGPSRSGQLPGVHKPGKPVPYTKTITYHRCVVTDCASNAFNNNDLAENTNILHCRVERVHNFWEGANRFTRVIGNYVRHAHCGSYGNVSARRNNLKELGTGQAIIADNIFEGGEFGNGIGIQLSPTQVIIANNTFVNFSNANAISVSGNSAQGRPARFVTITGNIIDLTHVPGQLNSRRAGIAISASNVIASNNQIYARGAADENVTGIQVSENAVNVTIHDNLIEHCAYGFRTGLVQVIVGVASGKVEQVLDFRRVESAVKEATGPQMFTESELPKEWVYGHGYRGWRLHWITGKNAGKIMTIESYDAATLLFKLKEPCVLAAGDRFAVFPHQANWFVHHNTISNCLHPVVLDGYGSETSIFKDNLICRPNIAACHPAVVVAGQYQVADNHTAGYEKQESVVRIPGFLQE